jgi:hypothetical protein
MMMMTHCFTHPDSHQEAAILFGYIVPRDLKMKRERPSAIYGSFPPSL